MKEMVGGCCVCSDERGWPENPLVYCDGQNCTVAVHQACYGIVTVPTGPWYCRKCESQERSARVRCELCPSRDGALKKTDNHGWAHVVCALYIPEVRFGNVTTMEPIILQLIPPERYSKNCYICQEIGKGSKAQVGACMQCNKTGCKQQFHVTCAQALGLLCEEAGNYLDNVKYCGYCQHHYSKLKKGGNVKTIPPYKPVTHTEAGSSDPPSSPEKESESLPASHHNTASTSASLKSVAASVAAREAATSGAAGAAAASSGGAGNASASGPQPNQLSGSSGTTSVGHSGVVSASSSSTSSSSSAGTGAHSVGGGSAGSGNVIGPPGSGGGVTSHGLSSSGAGGGVAGSGTGGFSSSGTNVSSSAKQRKSGGGTSGGGGNSGSGSSKSSAGQSGGSAMISGGSSGGSVQSANHLSGASPTMTPSQSAASSTTNMSGSHHSVGGIGSSGSGGGGRQGSSSVSSGSAKDKESNNVSGSSSSSKYSSKNSGKISSSSKSHDKEPREKSSKSSSSSSSSSKASHKESSGVLPSSMAVTATIMPIDSSGGAGSGAGSMLAPHAETTSGRSDPIHTAGGNNHSGASPRNSGSGSGPTTASSSSSTISVAKKRKVDTSKLASLNNSGSNSSINIDDINKDLIKDVSVTLVPLPAQMDHNDDKTSKKQKTAESTSSPLRIVNEPNLQNVSPNLPLHVSAIGGQSKQQVIQPPHNHNNPSGLSASTSSSHGNLQQSTSSSPSSSLLTSAASSSSAMSALPAHPSLVVSVPLSNANVPGVNLPPSTSATILQLNQHQNYPNTMHAMQRVTGDTHSRLSPSNNHPHQSQQQQHIQQQSHHQSNQHHSQSVLQSNPSQSKAGGHHSPIVHGASGGPPLPFNAIASASASVSLSNASSSTMAHISAMSCDRDGSSVLQSPGSQNTSSGSLMDLDPSCGGGGGSSSSNSLGGGLKITFEKQPNVRIAQLQDDAPGRRSRSQSGSCDIPVTANKTRNSKKRSAAAPSPLVMQSASMGVVDAIGASLPSTTNTAISRSSPFHQQQHQTHHHLQHAPPSHASSSPQLTTTITTTSTTSITTISNSSNSNTHSNGTNGTGPTTNSTNKPVSATNTNTNKSSSSATTSSHIADAIVTKSSISLSRGQNKNGHGSSNSSSSGVAGGPQAKKSRTQSIDSQPSTSSRTPDSQNHSNQLQPQQQQPLHHHQPSIYAGLSVTLAHNVGNAAPSASGGGSSSPFGGLKFGFEAQPSASAAAAAIASASAANNAVQPTATASGSGSTQTSTIQQPVTSAGSSGGGPGSLSVNVTPSVTPQPIKDSPPSSPGSEAGSSARKRNRPSTDTKDFKIFQNGVHVTHMLGNQLNPSSIVAQKMSDQLSMELEAHSVYTSSSLDSASQLVGPPFPGKQNQQQQQQQQRSSVAQGSGGQAAAQSSTSSGPPSLASMLGGNGTPTAAGNTPQSLEQLLERQWEQGSQFLMEQAQHFDIASLLSCLHQLRTENVRLEDHVTNLVARRDHLLAVNARLAIPLNPPVPQQTPAQFNNIHMNGPTVNDLVVNSSAAGRTTSNNSSSSGTNSLIGQPQTMQQQQQQQPSAILRGVNMNVGGSQQTTHNYGHGHQQQHTQQSQQHNIENGIDFRHGTSAQGSRTIEEEMMVK